MRYASQEGNIVEAKPGIINCVCQICNQQVIPKCGTIKVWHFAHVASEDCDSFSEPETEWHLAWKARFPKEYQEVVINNHRADVKLPSGLVVEFQNSPINSEDIIDRESFYGPMLWVLNGDSLAKGFKVRTPKQSFCCKSKIKDHFCQSCGSICKEELVTSHKNFRWYHPPKSWFSSERTIWIDLNNGTLFKIERLYSNVPCGGWGYIVSVKDFVEKIKMFRTSDDQSKGGKNNGKTDQKTE